MEGKDHSILLCFSNDHSSNINTCMCARHCTGCFSYSLSWAFQNKSVTQNLQFSLSVVSSSLRPHEPQHTRPPCPSSAPGVHPKPCPLSQWCHPTILSSVIPFSSCLQSFPAWVFSNQSVLPIRRPNIGASASASVLPMNIQCWFPLGLTGLIFLQSKGISILQHHNLKAPILGIP